MMKERGLVSGRSFGRMRDRYYPYALVAPMVTIFIIGGIVPVIYSFVLSFMKYKMNAPAAPRFVALGNYIALFSDEVFLTSLWKTLYYSAGVIVFSVLFGLLFALITRYKFVGKRLFMIILLLPWGIPKAVNGLMWKWILDPTAGVFTALCKLFGLVEENVYWFQVSPLVSITFVIVADVWKNIPFVMLLLLSALQLVPMQLYDAARCDGANKLQQFRHITLPEIMNTLLVVIMLQSISSLKVFDTLYTLTPLGGTDNMTTLTYMYSYKTSFTFLNFGYGSAIGYVVTLVTLVLSVFYVRAMLSRDAD